jgi:tRNA A-37 threonylcarbamoyl transferase component Bud32
VTEYLRVCPTCGAEHAPEVMRCACGALLAGIDLKRREAEPAGEPEEATSGAPAGEEIGVGAARASSESGSTPAAPAGSPAAIAGPTGATAGQTNATTAPGGQMRCPYPDCAQPNPPALAPQSLLRLPAALAARYRLVRALPARGAEADLLIVQAHEGGPERVAKIYRQGIAVRTEVRDRLARVAPGRQVAVLETGTADGHMYELMEYCADGSLRDLLARGRLEGETLSAMIRELAAALESIHAAGLVHRDLKPENVLVRARDPLALVLTDFNIASVIDATQRFTSVARTLPYASPESLSGVIDAKSDYWALGMIVLEAALGRHPFTGLSEAVILHQLTTRNVDLAAVADRNVRKLVRGLLLRDPAQRWGAAEIGRWLAGDPKLAEPQESGPVAGFAEPYRLGEEACTSPEQLAVALATHWREGLADLANGQLLRWFRGVQKDHNVVRLLIEIRHEKQLHVDVQLLRLILYLAPGIPPVWRGESIALPAILAHASQALEGSVEAAQWLHALYQHRVLEDYAEAGNPQMADVLARWNEAARRFDAAWRETLALLTRKAPERGRAEPVNWDQAVYGRADPNPPPVIGLHARLLAIAYDASWAERLRKRLLAELAPLLVHCPWLAGLGDPKTMDSTALLVLEALLPEARKVADRQIQAEIRKREEEAAACKQLAGELESIIAAAQATARARVPTEDVCIELVAECERFNQLAAHVRATGRSDAAWIELRNAVVRAEPVIRRLQRLAESLRERMTVGGGWLNARTLVLMGLLLIFAPRLGGRFALIAILAIGIGVVLWRIVPNFVALAHIRALAARL